MNAEDRRGWETAGHVHYEIFFAFQECRPGFRRDHGHVRFDVAGLFVLRVGLLTLRANEEPCLKPFRCHVDGNASFEVSLLVGVKCG